MCFTFDEMYKAIIIHGNAHIHKHSHTHKPMFFIKTIIVVTQQDVTPLLHTLIWGLRKHYITGYAF